MRSGNAITIMASLAVLSGCASTYSVTPGVEAKVFFAPDCPISGETGRSEVALAAIGTALLSNLAGSVVGSGIDALAQSLTTEKTATVNATGRYSDFFQLVNSKDVAIKVLHPEMTTSRAWPPPKQPPPPVPRRGRSADEGRLPSSWWKTTTRSGS